jgi:hypothetical protein
MVIEPLAETSFRSDKHIERIKSRIFINFMFSSTFSCCVLHANQILEIWIENCGKMV